MRRVLQSAVEYIISSCPSTSPTVVRPSHLDDDSDRAWLHWEWIADAMRTHPALVKEIAGRQLLIHPDRRLRLRMTRVFGAASSMAA